MISSSVSFAFLFITTQAAGISPASSSGNLHYIKANMRGKHLDTRPYIILMHLYLLLLSLKLYVEQHMYY
ncbi:hypothetical protein AQUCO_01800220v1 [Aquilegia coerulea]|uniref:Uncharacterized protein n=1 Tax=Aquilegia coerulea TaxID=218851 RepID=A0A2G5DKF5_AQUCA|nr:hypothetical protein AQUCO_01800220v1 [Aquilegia coerulea]